MIIHVMFMTQLLAGAILICVTVVIHALALDCIMKALERKGQVVYKKFKTSWKIILLVFTVLGVFSAHIVQMWVWALFYYYVDALSSFEEALYFSTSTFTTLGMGDLILGYDWRLLSTFQSANGFILFGWSTAFIFEVMSKLYKDEKIKKS